jgi:hypothetical protein
MQLRRMADASLALAERRPDDLKAAVERLGQAPPSNRQLMLLRFMALVAPPGNASALARVRGVAIILGLIVALVLVGTGIAQLIGLPFGGLSLLTSVWLGILIVILALVVLAVLGRRRQSRAQAARGAGPKK